MPPSWRTGLKQVLDMDGHGQSSFDWLTARKDATGKKRLDRALKELLWTLGPDIAKQVAGKTCIDFGSGYVPTDGVSLLLLGAKEVIGVDYNSIARPKEVAHAVRNADLAHVERQLAAVQLDAGWHTRLENLMRWAQQDGQHFPPNYTYLAPTDVISSPDSMPKFELLVSTSVLEHIPPSQLVPLLNALKSQELDHGVQIHRVDLRDHRAFDTDPYGFLDPARDFDAETEADARGNGMTLQSWECLLKNHPEWGLEVCRVVAGRPHLMPSGLATLNNHVVADSFVMQSASANLARRDKGV